MLGSAFLFGAALLNREILHGATLVQNDKTNNNVKHCFVILSEAKNLTVYSTVHKRKAEPKPDNSELNNVSFQIACLFYVRQHAVGGEHIGRKR